MNNTKETYNFPQGYSLFQGMLKAKELSADLLKFITKSMDKFGETYAASIGLTKKVILTQDPTFINHILTQNHRNYQRSELLTKRATQFYGEGFLFVNGAPWLRQRRLIQPSFHRQKISDLFQNVIQTIQDFLVDFPTGNNIDIYPLVHTASFNILLNSLFNIELALETRRELTQLFAHIENFTFKEAKRPLSKVLYRFNGTEKKAFAAAKRLRTIFLNIVKERRASKEVYSDLLDMLINSRFEDTGKTMSDEKIVDELIVLIQAGHDTTATTLAWVLYLLAKNPEVQKKLTSALTNHPIEAAINNDYLMAVIHETMRLYPTSWLVERTAIEADQFGNYSYPKETMIIGFYYGLHRNKKHWDSPLTFLPERFIKDPKLAKSKKFFPFGAGPRLCIGNHFAMAEMAFFIAALVKNFELEWTGQIPIKNPMATLRPNQVILNITSNFT